MQTRTAYLAGFVGVNFDHVPPGAIHLPLPSKSAVVASYPLLSNQLFFGLWVLLASVESTDSFLELEDQSGLLFLHKQVWQ